VFICEEIIAVTHSQVLRYKLCSASPNSCYFTPKVHQKQSQEGLKSKGYLMHAIPMQTASVVQLDHFKSGGYGSDL